MNTQPENFKSEIHAMDYTAQFEQYRVKADTLLTVSGRNVESLNGKWHFVADPYETALRAGWYKEEHKSIDKLSLPCDFDFDYWPLVNVPSCWNMENPELYLYENMGLYMREFNYQPNDERTFLHFEGALYRTYVFLNGKPIALHDGGSTPFTVEVTGMLLETNRLIVAVDAARSKSRVPMDNTDWFNYGGLYRDVLFVRTPKAMIQDWFIRLLPDSDYAMIALDVTVDGLTEGEAILSIPELQIEKKIAIEEGKGTLAFEAHPRLWSPEDPKLYEVSLRFCSDTVCEQIGFREFKVKGTKCYLNGVERYLAGVCVHEDHCTLGKTTNDSVIRETIKNLKELNGCFLRLAHYPHSRRFAQIADEMGVMLWEEIPVYWAIDFGNPATFADAKNQLSELIVRDRNRASVVIWSVGNENPDTDERYSFMSRLANHARSLDGTRAISAACLVNETRMIIEDRLIDSLDIIGNNEYCGWYIPDFNYLLKILDNSKPSKPVIITEFGGGARSGHHGTKDTMWTEEFQEELYRKQFATMATCPYIQGTTPWILIDFRAVRRLNRYQDGFNRKGLIDSDRTTKKLAFKVVADYYKTKK